MVSPRPFNIRIFVADGQPDGLRLVEKSNWVGLGVVCPRSRYPKVKSRSEFDNSAVYILTGSDDESELPMVYVGEAETVRARLDSHHANKDFWQQAIVFTTRGDPLNKAEVQYLEARLVEIAKACGRCKLDNGNTPKRPGLSEADQAQIEGYLEEMLSLLPVLGVHQFDDQEKAPASTDRRMYTCGAKDWDAEGYESNAGFVVKKGSQAKGTTTTSMTLGLKLRDALLANGILVPDGDHYRFSKNFEFGSPSVAAAIVLGRQANGRTEWKDASGVTLKEHQLAESEVHAEA